jgi:tetratricopeptide (TPR) repeat protein
MVLVLILAIICVYRVISLVQCGSNEGDDVDICMVMITFGSAIPFILLSAAFFLVRKYPIVFGLILVGIGAVILALPYSDMYSFLIIFLILWMDGVYFFPVAFITDGLLFIISGLLELKDRRMYEHKDSLPERLAESAYPTQQACLTPRWSTRKKTIFIFIGVLLVLAATATIDLVRYNQAITRTRESALNHFNRGLVYAGNGDFANAVNEYRQAIQLSPHYTEAYYNRGLAYLSLSVVEPHIGDAFDDFDHVIQLDPSFTMAYYYRGIFNIYGSNQWNAINDLSHFLQLNPNNEKAYNFRGLTYYNLGDLDDAIRDFDQAIQLDPDFAIPYNNRGLAYARMDNLDRAITDYDQAILLKPDFGAAYDNRGQAYYDKGDLDLAISDWEQALRIKPEAGLYLTRGYTNYDNSEVYDNLGLIYYDKGDLDLAISEFDQAIQLRPGFGLAHFNRGVAYYDKGMYSDALNDIDLGQPDCPDDIQYFFYRGLIYYYTDYPASAIQSFYVVLTRNPDYALLFKDWSRTFGGEGYLDRVISDFGRAIQLYPNDPQTYFFRGLTYSIKGETENAIADLTLVLKLCGTNTSLCKEAQHAVKKLGGL